MSVNEKMTAIANAIRKHTLKTDALTLDDMALGVNEVYEAGKQSGGGTDYLQYTTLAKFPDLNKFNQSEVVLNIPLVTDYSGLLNATVSNTTVEHLTINGADDGAITAAVEAFRAGSKSDSKLTHLTLNCDFSKCENFNRIFYDRNALEIIDGTPIDFSSATNIMAIIATTALKELRVKPESIKVIIRFSNQSKLSHDTIASLFDGLATVGTTQTLTLNSTLKILQSQKDSANAKGWTVSGGKVVSEEEYYG